MEPVTEVCAREQQAGFLRGGSPYTRGLPNYDGGCSGALAVPVAVRPNGTHCRGGRACSPYGPLVARSRVVGSQARGGQPQFSRDIHHTRRARRGHGGRLLRRAQPHCGHPRTGDRWDRGTGLPVDRPAPQSRGRVCLHAYHRWGRRGGRLPGIPPVKVDRALRGPLANPHRTCRPRSRHPVHAESRSTSPLQRDPGLAESRRVRDAFASLWVRLWDAVRTHRESNHSRACPHGGQHARHYRLLIRRRGRPA